MEVHLCDDSNSGTATAAAAAHQLMPSMATWSGLTKATTATKQQSNIKSPRALTLLADSAAGNSYICTSVCMWVCSFGPNQCHNQAMMIIDRKCHMSVKILSAIWSDV